MINNTAHYVGIISANNTAIVINVSSDPQQATFKIGDEKKFEVTNDSYYDILVRLVGINAGYSTLMIKSIHDEIPAQILPPPVNQTPPGNQTPPVNQTTPPEPGAGMSLRAKILWVVGIIIILLIVGLLAWLYKKNRYYLKGF
jgi:hypothetical protein